jgi:hypothetical protein
LVMVTSAVASIPVGAAAVTLPAVSGAVAVSDAAPAVSRPPPQPVAANRTAKAAVIVRCMAMLPMRRWTRTECRTVIDHQSSATPHSDLRGRRMQIATGKGHLARRAGDALAVTHFFLGLSRSAGIGNGARITWPE